MHVICLEVGFDSLPYKQGKFYLDKLESLLQGQACLEPIWLLSYLRVGVVTRSDQLDYETTSLICQSWLAFIHKHTNLVYQPQWLCALYDDQLIPCAVGSCQAAQLTYHLGKQQPVPSAEAYPHKTLAYHTRLAKLETYIASDSKLIPILPYKEYLAQLSHYVEHSHLLWVEFSMSFNNEHEPFIYDYVIRTILAQKLGVIFFVDQERAGLHDQFLIIIAASPTSNLSAIKRGWQNKVRNTLNNILELYRLSLTQCHIANNNPLAAEQDLIKQLCQKVAPTFSQAAMTACDFMYADRNTVLVDEYPKLAYLLSSKYSLNQGSTVEAGQVLRELSPAYYLPRSKDAMLIIIARSINYLLHLWVEYNLVNHSLKQDPFHLRPLTLQLINYAREQEIDLAAVVQAHPQHFNKDSFISFLERRIASFYQHRLGYKYVLSVYKTHPYNIERQLESYSQHQALYLNLIKVAKRIFPLIKSYDSIRDPNLPEHLSAIEKQLQTWIQYTNSGSTSELLPQLVSLPELITEFLDQHLVEDKNLLCKLYRIYILQQVLVVISKVIKLDYL